MIPLCNLWRVPWREQAFEKRINLYSNGRIIRSAVEAQGKTRCSAPYLYQPTARYSTLTNGPNKMT